MDAVMGLTAEQYLALEQDCTSVRLKDFLRTYFVDSVFQVFVQNSELVSFSLRPGCQLTFLAWLGQQPTFQAGQLDALLYGDGLNEFAGNLEFSSSFSSAPRLCKWGPWDVDE
jgi:hypothetical protein